MLIVAGSPQMPGPAILAATAALRVGAGKLQIATCESIALHVAAAVPEALVVPFAQSESGAILPAAAAEIARRANRVDALVFGPGLTQDATCAGLFASLAPRLERPAVFDAAALAFVRDRAGALGKLGSRAVLTPHAGEMAAMLGIERDVVEADPASHVLEAVRRFGTVVALKGAATYIATPQGELFCNRYGHVGLATSGSGDTLAGVIGGILARGAGPAEAAIWGVFLHAQAGLTLGRKMGVGFLARELLAELPPIMRRLSARNTAAARGK